MERLIVYQMRFEKLTRIKGSKKPPKKIFDVISNVPGLRRVLAKDPDPDPKVRVPPKSAGPGPGPAMDPLQVYPRPRNMQSFLVLGFLETLPHMAFISLLTLIYLVIYVVTYLLYPK
jgi:hypothetical protein